MDCRTPMLESPVEDGKAVEKKTARPFMTFEWVCELMILNCLFCTMDWIRYPLVIERIAPSQAADFRALLSVMLWLSVAAAAAAVLALRQQPAGHRRLALALAALASTAATHGIRIRLLCLRIACSTTGDADESRYYLKSYSIVAVGAIFLAVLDVLAFVALLRGAGAEEEK